MTAFPTSEHVLIFYGKKRSLANANQSRQILLKKIQEMEKEKNILLKQIDNSESLLPSVTAFQTTEINTEVELDKRIEEMASWMEVGY